MNERNDASHLVRVLVYQLIQEGLDLQDIPEYVGYLCRRAVLQPSTDPGGVGEIIEASKEGQVRTDYELLWLIRACLMEVSLRVPDHLLADSSPGFSQEIS
ncbi:MAG: hypothetical protein JRI80_18440 [Deltaproteobacteria bacterium]|nr:hypothetical protein [Deltaproteobacteria bacterium]